MKILGIESSCDEMGASVYDTKKGLCSNELFSQIDLHRAYGGVVPEIASRSHMEKIIPIVESALHKAGVMLSDIDVFAVTTKPGLPGSLMIGLSFAKSLAYSENKKLIGVNHLEGHIFSACIGQDIPFPFLCLTASGGHTSLYLVKGYGDFELIADTLDDAAGEAFDKIAYILELPYPGGKEIEKCAKAVDYEDFYKYTRGKKDSLDFSFSGLKTGVLYHMQKNGWYDVIKKKLNKPSEQEFLFIRNQIASSLLVCVKDIFLMKLALALKKHSNIAAIAFVGGVSCNLYLQKELRNFCEFKKISFFVPRNFTLCTDNAGMIAFVGHYKAQQEQYDDLLLSIF